MRTTSTSFSTGAGLKKCIPTTRSGRPVTSAISVTESADVLVARIASGASRRIELLEDGRLGRDVLDHGLDHEVAAGERAEVGGEREPSRAIASFCSAVIRPFSTPRLR